MLSLISICVRPFQVAEVVESLGSAGIDEAFVIEDVGLFRLSDAVSSGVSDAEKVPLSVVWAFVECERVQEAAVAMARCSQEWFSRAEQKGGRQEVLADEFPALVWEHGLEVVMDIGTGAEILSEKERLRRSVEMYRLRRRNLEDSWKYAESLERRVGLLEGTMESE